MAISERDLFIAAAHIAAGALANPANGQTQYNEQAFFERALEAARQTAYVKGMAIITNEFEEEVHDSVNRS